MMLYKTKDNRDTPSRHPFKRILLAFCLCLLSIFSSISSSGEKTDIDKVRAVFLFNLTSFVTWPDSAFPKASSPLIFCLLGDTHTGDYLEEVVRGERIKNRPVKLQRPRDPQSIEHCHILLIEESKSQQYDVKHSNLMNLPILSVSSRTGFAQDGGILTLHTRGNRLHPIINLEAVNKANLKISSRVLRLATIISSDGGEE